VRKFHDDHRAFDEAGVVRIGVQVRARTARTRARTHTPHA
jgi:hypothetical protein